MNVLFTASHQWAGLNGSTLRSGRYWDERASGADIHRIRTDGTGLERLTSLDSATNRILRPRYTPDGGWILFMQQEAGRSSLLAIPADGGDPVDVLPGTMVFDYDVRSGE